MEKLFWFKVIGKHCSVYCQSKNILLVYKALGEIEKDEWFVVECEPPETQIEKFKRLYGGQNE